jgi:Asp-tRNA(Asn)/Glu-tRNA(Gln) amidotransferase A subunit family amidase
VQYTDSDLHYISATEAIGAFKAKELSPVELVEAVIGRIETTNDEVNCLTYMYFDRAREQARKAEDVYANSPDSARPLEGVPCAIKDWHSVAGEVTTYGSRAFKDFRPDQTAPTVERLLDAGAVMHCRTTTPEFAHSGNTKSPLWGITRNPWNLDYSAGGSSGGAGAALAAGMTTLADGTDGGGSIRIPASANGVVGYKPPFGRNPLDREHPGETVLHYGPLARTVADVALMQNVMSGPHPADLYSLRDRVELPAEFEDLRGWRIALSMDLGYYAVSETVRENTRKAAEAFTELGCTVDEVDLGWDESVLEAWLTNWEGLFWALMNDMFSRWRFALDPFVVKILERGSHRTVPEFYGVQRTRYEMYQKLGAILEDHDILICPTLAVPSVKAEHDNDEPDFEIDGKPVYPYVGWILTYPFNLVSQCPVASVPSGFCPETGVPTGLQIVAKTFDDLSVFRAAAAFEQARPWGEQHPTLGREMRAPAPA